MHGTVTPLQRVYTPEDLDLLEAQAILQARDDFWAFRQYMNPDMLLGWWQYEVAQELTKWYVDLLAGKRPVLVLSAPPQHGKSTQMVEFLAWLAGKNPNWKSIYASFSSKLGERANATLQRMMDGDRYRKVFPKTLLALPSDKGKYDRNATQLDFVGFKGSFYNTTVEGQINGQGLDIGLIDDPMKGRLEAASKTNRDKAWIWFTDDFFGRFSAMAGMIMIMTRWHVDDIVGRFTAKFPRARFLVYPAIAEKNEKYRRKGEALFPEHKPLDFLKERQGLLAQASWESVWQQNPIVVGGGMFPIEKFHVYNSIPARDEIKKSVRYWDKAGTKDGGAYTCGVLMHELKSGRIVVSNVKRGQWAALEREQTMKDTAETDKANYGSVAIWVEQEPGSGGKESAEATIRNLRGYVVKADKVTGDKVSRAEPYAAQVQGGNVGIVSGDWTEDFVDEHETFPGGKFKDQVDATAGAFAKLSNKQYGSYDSSLSWVDN